MTGTVSLCVLLGGGGTRDGNQTNLPLGPLLGVPPPLCCCPESPLDQATRQEGQGRVLTGPCMGQFSWVPRARGVPASAQGNLSGLCCVRV